MSKNLTRKMNFRFDEITASKIEHIADKEGISTSDVVRDLVTQKIDNMEGLNRDIMDSRLKIIESSLNRNDTLIIKSKFTEAEVYYDNFSVKLIEPEHNEIYHLIGIDLFLKGKLISTFVVNQNSKVDVNIHGVLIITVM